MVCQENTLEELKFSYLKYLILSDLKRYSGGRKGFFRHFLFVPGFTYTFWLRIAYFCKMKSEILALPYIVAKVLLRRYSFKYGIDIPYNTSIGPGLYIGHFGGIVISHKAKIGMNCNINHGVTIGSTYGGKHPGSPVIGNRVYLGPGSKIMGAVTIGNDVAVGANAVVTESVPDKAVVVGIPGKIVSFKGSKNYVVNLAEPCNET